MSGDFLSDEEFADRYMITSVKGRVYTRSMLFVVAMNRIRSSPLPVGTVSARPRDWSGTISARPRVWFPREGREGSASLGSLDVGERMMLTNTILNDDGFMRRLAGQVPARVVEAIEDRAWEMVRGW